MEKKRKNVLIISHYFWPEDFKINELALGLNKYYNVSILTGYPSYPNKKVFKNLRYSKYKNIEIFRVPVLKRNLTNLSIFFNYLSFLIFLPLYGLYLLRGKSFDFIFVYQPSPITVGLSGILIKYFKKCKMAIWVNDLWPDTLDYINPKIFRYLKSIFNHITNLIYNYSDHILIQSKGFKKFIKNKDHKKKLIFFPNWIDTTNYEKTQINKKNKTILNNKIFKIMYIGNIGYSQEFDGIIKFLKLLKMQKILINFIVIGEGRKKKYVKQSVKDFGLQNYVYFFGRVKKEFIKNYSDYTDMLFMSLKKNKLFDSTIPAKLQTYLSLQKPIIAFNSGETEKIIQDLQCGLTVNKKNYNKAFKNIRKYIKDKKLLIKFNKKRKQKKYNKFIFEKVVTDLKILIG